MRNKNAELLKRFDVSARPRGLKFGAHGTRPSTAAEAGQSRTAEASDSDDDLPGHGRTRRLKQRAKGCVNQILKQDVPNKKLTRAGNGAISAFAADLSSAEIPPSKPLVPDICSREEEDAFIAWQNEFEQDCDIGSNWRREFAEALLDEGKFLEGAYLTMPEGKLPRDMTRDEIVANWQEVNKAKVNEINGPFDLGCFQRYPRANSHYIIDARWAII